MHLPEDICYQQKEKNYSRKATAALKDPYSQLMSLQNTYTQASIAKMAIDQVRKIAQDTTQHSFNGKVHQVITEVTMQRYVVKCWGCNQSGHSYANKQGQITCTNKDKPDIQEKAEILRKDSNDCQRKKKITRRKNAKHNVNT
jgi:hypothetical protein